tara:strand:- start:422 stop:778 length:357 start_codon:yes stop_codon:yes gene_type:complete
MENLTTNKKIGLACGIGLLISFFLPFFSVMGMSASLMDAAEATAIVWIFPLCGVAAAFLTFKDKVGMARIAFLISLGLMIYRVFLEEGSPGMDITEVAGIGFYLLIVTSAAGAIFSKE